MNQHKEQTANFDLQAVFETSKILNASLSTSHICSHFLLVIMGRMMVAKSAFFLKDAKGRLELICQKGFHYKDLPEFCPREYLQSDEPIALKQLPDEALKEFSSRHGLELFFPIFSQNKCIGLAGFGKKLNKAEFNAAEYQFIGALTSIVATAIANAQSFENSKQLNEQLDKRVYHLNTIFDISKQFNTAFDENEIANLLGLILMGQFLINKYFIFLKNEDTWSLLNCKGVAEKEVLPIFEATELEDHNTIVDTQKQGFYKYSDLKIHYLLPITFQNKMKGVIGLGKPMRQDVISDDNIEFLNTIANVTISSLENAQLFRQELRRKQLEEEMRLARTIQKQLLPETIPQTDLLKCDAINIPSLDVGGDLFDIFHISPHRILYAIADVTGKGTPAAILMSNLQAALRSVADDEMDLSVATQKINRIIYNNTTSDKFITCFIGILDTQTNRFTFVNAGHNQPYHYCAQSKKLQLLEDGGLLLGIMEQTDYDVGAIELHPNDVIYMYTDGVSEALNVQEEEFGEDAIEKLILAHPKASPEEFNKMIISAVEQHRGHYPQSDDITMITLKQLG
jgi:sigma-B regulation protein RsbU (phosphoserine phosphatase)